MFSSYLGNISDESFRKESLRKINFTLIFVCFGKLLRTFKKRFVNHDSLINFVHWQFLIAILRALGFSVRLVMSLQVKSFLFVYYVNAKETGQKFVLF